MLRCQKCGSPIPEGALFCPGCGQKSAEVAEAVCDYCGGPARLGEHNCPSCGAPMPAVYLPRPEPEVRTVEKVYVEVPATRPPNVSEKNRWLALVLAVFLGFLGVHRFYVGKIGTGILWLITGGFSGVGWFIDCVCILFGWFSDREGRRLK